jgi:putative transposase|tara:strand:- start:157 stop:1515 length:1359 start_codon:yes stop_codon:yes gene_type:complete
MDIITLLQVLRQGLDTTTVRRLSVLVRAMLTMTGRITMLGLSRWAEKGGSYRTIQRFYNTTIPWGTTLWLFFKAHLYQSGTDYLLVGDESVVTKAGKTTHGLDRFFSSLFGKPVPGLAFLAFSLVSIKERKSYPLLVEQVVRSDEEKARIQQQKAAQASQKRTASKKKGKPGRPQGSPNKNKRQIHWNEELHRVKRMASTLIARVHPLDLRYLVLDGHFGTNQVMQMVRQSLSLHLVSKLRHDSALYFLYEGPQKPVGRKRVYGAKIDYEHIPSNYLVQTDTHEGIQTDIYQATMSHKSFADRLNVVIIVKTNLSTQQRAKVLLFSSDLDLAYDSLIDYYQLRFQIEFNFRDAKQFWGFEDFMNVQPTPVTNAVGLSFFMVNFSHLLLTPFRQAIPEGSLLDLKAHFRAQRYAREALKLLPERADPILIDQMLKAMPALGAIRPQNAPLAPL